MRLGLYSITYLGVWYRGPALTLTEVVDRAKSFGYDGVEIDGKRPHGNPTDMPPERCRELRRYAEDAGIEIYAVAANNDFSSPIPEQRESQLIYIRELIRTTANLGARVLRIFAAWPGVTLDDTGGRYDIAQKVWGVAHGDCDPEQTWAWCREGLAEAARWADQQGVTLALQNHPPVIDTPEAVLRMIREVGSPALNACLDAPLARKQGIQSMEATARSAGALQVLTHFGGEYDEDTQGRIVGCVRNRDGSLSPEDFYSGFTRGMHEIGYTGYTGYELCHPLPKVNGVTVGLDFVDKNARLAALYMRGVMASVVPRATALQIQR